jgi:uncharacterized protein YerC
MTQVSRIPLSSEIEKRIFEIFLDSVAEVKTRGEVEKFLDDLLSPTERVMLAKRLSIAFLLHKGYDQRSICRILKVSLGTVNKVSLGLKLGGEGYQRVIRKIIQGEKMEEFWQKVDDFISDIVPPKGRDWRAWRKSRWQEKMASQKPF